MFANGLISWFSSKESTPNTTSDATSIENHQPTSPKAPSTDRMMIEQPVCHTRPNYPQISLTNPTNTLPELPGEHAEAAWWRCRRYLLRPVSQTRPNHISPNKTDIHLVVPVFSASSAVSAVRIAASCAVVRSRRPLGPFDLLDTFLYV